MAEEKIKTGECGQRDDGKLDREFVRKWLINFQHDLVMNRYNCVPHGEHLRDLFVKYLYPDYAHRANYEARNELFRWAAKMYKSGKLDRVLGVTNFLFHRWLDAIKTEKELPFYIDAVIESYDLTCEIDEKMVDTIRDMARSEADLNMETYKRAFNLCSTREQRYKQVENLVGAGEYAKAIIERGGLIDFLIERLPLIPLLSRNRFIGAINEATGMIKAAYRAFKKSRGHLDDLRDTIRTLEIGFIDEMLGPPETPYTPPPFATVPGMIKK
jgi:hypothetical protein